MKFTTSRESLLKPLQAVAGVVERRQTMPILANVMISVSGKELGITATDLEVELVARSEAEKVESDGDITVPGRKLLDICRALPAGAAIKVSLSGDRLTLSCGRSRFVLSTLPAAEFPVVEDVEAGHKVKLPQASFRRLLDKTQFSMAQQDVRYYLNGLLLETGGHTMRAVATDGHRLAIAETSLEGKKLPEQQVIVPRKGVLELQRLLGDEGDMELAIGRNHVRAVVGDIVFTSKLIDGRFPDYQRVIPALAEGEGLIITGDRESLKGALQRAAILSNEKYRGVRLEIRPETLIIQANNPDQEEALDEVAVDYNGTDMEIGFNVNYLLDALGAVDEEQVCIAFVDDESSCLIHGAGQQQSRYVVMPMRL